MATQKQLTQELFDWNLEKYIVDLGALQTDMVPALLGFTEELEDAEAQEEVTAALVNIGAAISHLMKIAKS